MKHILYKNTSKLFINKNSLVYKITLSFLLSWAYALTSQACITLPFEFVPITLQTFAFFLAPLFLGQIAFYASCFWYIQGALGLPMFFGFSGSITHILGPTGGYLIGFLIASYYLSFLKIRKSKNNITLFLHMFAALLILHSCGTLYRSLFAPFNINVILFFVVDLIKISLILLSLKLNPSEKKEIIERKHKC